MLKSILASLEMEFELLSLQEKVAAKSFVGNGLDKSRKLNYRAKKKVFDRKRVGFKMKSLTRPTNLFVLNLFFQLSGLISYLRVE